MKVRLFYIQLGNKLNHKGEPQRDRHSHQTWSPARDHNFPFLAAIATAPCNVSRYYIIVSNVYQYLQISSSIFMYQLSYFVKLLFLQIRASSLTAMLSMWHIENVGRDLVLRRVSQVGSAFVLRSCRTTLHSTVPEKA